MPALEIAADRVLPGARRAGERDQRRVGLSRLVSMAAPPGELFAIAIVEPAGGEEIGEDDRPAARIQRRAVI
jgi:hypothetical protein